jgi:hypothetical protein
VQFLYLYLFKYLNGIKRFILRKFKWEN